MSSTLRWRPLPTPEEGSFGVGLKHILRRESGWEGSDEPLTEWTPFGIDWLPFLKGVIAGSRGEVTEDAQRLYELIQKHGTIELKEEF